MLDKAPARVLVTDGQDRSGLAAVRCLGRSGYRVTCTATGRTSPGLWSRWCVSRQVLPDPRIDLDAFTGELVTLLDGSPQDVLVPVRDETLFAISARREQFPSRALAGLPTHEAVQRALSKLVLGTAASEAGLAPPEQRFCLSADDALTAAQQFGYPILVKPERVVAEVDGRIVRYPSVPAANASELLSAQAEMGACIVERRVAGALLSVSAVATGDGLVSPVVARSIRIWPPDAGHASFSVTIVPPPGLLQRVAALVQAVGWTGMFQLELIELEDGTLHAIDFNPRPYGSIALARGARVPLTTIWSRWLLGQPSPSAVARPGVHFRLEETELAHVLACLRAGELRRVITVITPRRHVVHGYTDVCDPLPALIQAARIMWFEVEARRSRAVSRSPV